MKVSKQVNMNDVQFEEEPERSQMFQDCGAGQGTGEENQNNHMNE